MNFTLSCFCQFEFEKKGLPLVWTSYRRDGYDMLPPQMLEDIIAKEETAEPSQHICWSYVAQDQFQTAIYWCISIMIIIFNALFYVFTPPFIESIGMNLKTDETRMIVNAITVCLVVDMIVLPMVIGMNLQEYTTMGKEDTVEDVLKFLGIKWGRNTDFGANWYIDTGAIIMMTMLIFSFQPVIDFLTEWITCVIYRCCINRSYANEKKARRLAEEDGGNHEHDPGNEVISKYLQVKAGPPYLFYYQCANVNCLVMVCLILGPLMPWMYWMAFYGVLIHYVLDRLTLAFFYRTPATFSPKMTQNNLKFYRWCPIFSLALTFWIYSNKQMFDTVIEPINAPKSIRKSFHLITNLDFDKLEYWQKKPLYMLAFYITLFAVVEAYLAYEKSKRKNEVQFQSAELSPYF